MARWFGVAVIEHLVCPQRNHDMTDLFGHHCPTRHLFISADFVSMDDNAHPHRAYKEDDINSWNGRLALPIEHAWRMLGGKAVARYLPLASLLEICISLIVD